MSGYFILGFYWYGISIIIRPDIVRISLGFLVVCFCSQDIEYVMAVLAQDNLLLRNSLQLAQAGNQPVKTETDAPKE